RKAAFTGASVVAVLAKIIFDEPPRMRELRPGIPASLDDLCARMLAKDPRSRPRDGAGVVDAIRGIEVAAVLTETLSARPPGALAAALTGQERRVVSVVLSSRGPSIAGGTVQPQAETHLALDPAELCRTAAPHGGHVELLVDGSILITIVGTGV